MADQTFPYAAGRDRHGRGFRSGVVPAHLPGFMSRRDYFDRLLTDSMNPLLARYGKKLEYVQVLVEETPRDASILSARALGRYIPGTRSTPPRIIVYRRPIEDRCATRAELHDLVYTVVVENVAAALGTTPEHIDPWFFG